MPSENQSTNDARHCQGVFPNLTNNFVTKNICQNVTKKIPSNDIKGLKLPIYLTGKASCSKNTSKNAWMDPVRKGNASCFKLIGKIFRAAC